MRRPRARARVLNTHTVLLLRMLSPSYKEKDREGQPGCRRENVMTDKSRGTCASCRHWQQGAGEAALAFPEHPEWRAEHGECRRTSPTVVSSAELGTESAWPGTYATAWCSEYRTDDA